MAVLPGVLGCSFDFAQDRRTLRRIVQVRLGTNTLWLPGGTPIFAVSRQEFMKYPGWYLETELCTGGPKETTLCKVAEKVPIFARKH